MTNRTRSIMLKIIKGFTKKSVLLLGDSILDIYVYGSAIGKSLETPTIVAKEEETKRSFGGSSLVVRNILELGGKVKYITILGNDEESKYYQELNHKNLIKYLIIDKTRRTTVKKRFWIDGYKMLQIDNLDNRDISPDIENKVLAAYKKEIKNCDIVVISDYNHGMMTENLIKQTIKIAGQANRKVLVDSQISHRESAHHLYKGCSLMLLNEKEARAVDPKFLDKLKNFTGLQARIGSSTDFCIKLGEKGSLSFINNKIIQTPGLKIKPIDTCGAGDAFLAALCISDDKYMKESLQIANWWAGLSTLVHGTIPPKKTALLKKVR